MAESLLSPSGIKLYGREFPGFSAANLPGGSLGDNSFLRKQIEAAGARFARIYGFSYEGSYYSLPRPTIFLVHGGGDPTFPPVPETPGPPEVAGGPPAALAHTPPHSQMAQGPSDTDQSGVPNKNWDFSSDIYVWDYDKGDFSLRLDVTAGTFEDILLEAEIESHLQISSAARVQISGAARMQVSHAARMQVALRSRE